MNITDTALKFILAFRASCIYTDINKKYQKLTGLCNKEKIDEILNQAATGKIKLYVFCEYSGTSHLFDIVDNLDMTPYVIPFDNGDIINLKGEIKLKEMGIPGGVLVSLEQLKVYIRLLNNQGVPGFHELSLDRAQDLNFNGKTICKTSKWFSVNGEILEPSIDKNIEVTIENVCVYEDDFKSSIFFNNVEKLPPLLRLASECREELFNKLFPPGDKAFISKSIRDETTNWLNNNYPGLLAADIKAISILIQPDNFKTSKINKRYNGSKNPEIFQSEEFDLALDIWGKIKEHPAALEKELKSYETQKLLYNRLKKVLDITKKIPDRVTQQPNDHSAKI